MPHTQSRYQQDLGFTDGIILCAPVNFFISASATFTRNAAADFSVNLGSSLGPITLSADILDGQVLRTGFGEDLQEQFGGTGIPASAQPQFYRPDVIGAMSSIQQITPRTVLKTKGIKVNSINVYSQIGVANLTTYNARLDSAALVAGTAGATVVSIIANGANGLSKTFTGQIAKTNIPITTPAYLTSDAIHLWAELTVTTPASSTYRLYGIEAVCEFNYN